jgi:hypothetical protein
VQHFDQLFEVVRCTARSASLAAAKDVAKSDDDVETVGDNDEHRGDGRLRHLHTDCDVVDVEHVDGKYHNRPHVFVQSPSCVGDDKLRGLLEHGHDDHQKGLLGTGKSVKDRRKERVCHSNAPLGKYDRCLRLDMLPKNRRPRQGALSNYQQRESQDDQQIRSNHEDITERDREAPRSCNGHG